MTLDDIIQKLDFLEKRVCVLESENIENTNLIYELNIELEMIRKSND